MVEWLKDRCIACRERLLAIDPDGWIVCTWAECPNPAAVSDLLRDWYELHRAEIFDPTEAADDNPQRSTGLVFDDDTRSLPAGHFVLVPASFVGDTSDAP